MRRRTASAGALAAALCVLATACGGGGGGKGAAAPPKSPVGKPVLPDLAPAPPGDIQMQKANGRWNLRFSSILANVGKGDFILRATREGTGPWHVEQDIPYSQSGAKPTPVPAEVVWGGDTHNHWHIRRVAAVHLVPFGPTGKPPAFTTKARVDSKIGFCFFDYSRAIGGPEKAVYSRESCGHDEQKDTQIGMGLSVGWVDVYPYPLRGQSIDVTGLADGTYRLYATVDDAHWFRERTRTNNMTWVDVKLMTNASGARTVRTVGFGPAIHSGP